MTTKTAKKFRTAAELVDRNKRYGVDEAFKLLKETVAKRAVKFDQTVDVAINLGVDPKHADQMVRGAVVLPNGIGKTVRVAVFAKGEKQREAQDAGADVVGEADLAKRIEEGFMDFDTVIATPDMMGVVGRLGKVLGPRGLMPNPKVGTVTADVGKAIREAKGGKVEFRAEKAGIVHAPVGKASFPAEKLAENFNALMELVMKLKPSTAKGVYLKGATISATMTPGIKLDVQEIGARIHVLLSFTLITFVFTVLGVLEVDVARTNIESLRNRETAHTILQSSERIADKFQKYMLVRSIMSVLTGAVVWGFALLAGLELATAWGVIAFVLNYIPFIGPLVATVFPTLFALAQFESWRLAITVFLCLNLIQFLIGSYLEPRIAGAALAVSPFLVLFAVFFWAFLWGIPGAFIGVPIVIAILTVCEQRESTRWVATLLSGSKGKAA